MKIKPSTDDVPGGTIIDSTVGAVYPEDVASYLRAHLNHCPELSNPAMHFSRFARLFKQCGVSLAAQRRSCSSKGDGFLMMTCEEGHPANMKIVIRHSFDGEVLRQAEVVFGHESLVSWFQGEKMTRSAAVGA